MIKEAIFRSSFSAFEAIKKENGVQYVIQELKLNKGTIKRWEKEKSVPDNYISDLERLLNKLNEENPHNNAVIIKAGSLINNNKKYDEFYTTDETAKHCFDILKKELKNINLNWEEYDFIEPSAGGGSFYRLFPSNKVIGVDINNINKNYVCKNYLDFYPSKKSKFIVFGNPPFGLRGNLALRFINHSYNFADIVAFILPPLFSSDGKGTPKERVKGYKLLYSENLPLASFEYPDGKKVKVSTVFQIWTKVNTELIKKSDSKTASKFVKIYSLSDGGTPGSTRNKDMIGKCDVYLPSTCFKGMKPYESFEDLPNKRGYGIKILEKKDKIEKIFRKTDWEKVAFLSTNSALNLRMSLITKVITDAGFFDED